MGGWVLSTRDRGRLRENEEVREALSRQCVSCSPKGRSGDEKGSSHRDVGFSSTAVIAAGQGNGPNLGMTNSLALEIFKWKMPPDLLAVIL